MCSSDLKRVNTQKERRSDSVKERERREEIEVYLGLPSIGPPSIGNPKAHKKIVSPSRG